MISVASWGIFTTWNELIAQIPYKFAEDAKRLVERLNSNLPRVNEPFYLRVVKEPINKVPARLILVVSSERVVRGFGTDKYTGEKKRWSKVFLDIETTTLTDEGNFVLDETFTAHKFRGDIRVIANGVSMTSHDFEIYAKKRWPTTYAELLIRLP